MTTSKGLMFIGTLNNPDTTTMEDYLQNWLKHGAAYVTGQLEKVTTVHLQYFIHMKVQTRISALKKVCQHSHFELVKKDNGCTEYCNKEETRIEGPWTFGIRPAKLYKQGDRARQNIELITMGPVKALEEGLISVKDYTRVKQGINAYKIDKQVPYEHIATRGVWIYGPSGTGKSHTARHELTLGEYFIKPQNKWFDGYDGQKTIILDDLDEHFLGHYLKIWMDHYSCTGEVKNSTVPLLHERFIVTSNKSIEEIFVDKPMMIEPILRRCTVYHMTEPFTHPGVQKLAKL